MAEAYHHKKPLTMPNDLPHHALMSRKKFDDPTWLYPHATRVQIENLRIYFELHLPNRIRSWHQQTCKDTHALPRIKENWGSGEPWASVPPHFRARVDAWFHMMIARVKRERGTITPGKIRSLRMNAAYYGRYVLTGKRRANKSAYDRMKRKWLQYKEWEAQQQRRELVASRGPMPRKVLECA
jgi:hypothetical protein